MNSTVFINVQNQDIIQRNMERIEGEKSTALFLHKTMGPKELANLVLDT